VKPTHEHRLIAAMLMGVDMEPAAMLRPEHFGDARAGEIWRAGWELIDGDRRVDLAGLERTLRALDRWAFVGELAALAHFADVPQPTWTPSSIREAALLVRKSADLRRLRGLAGEIVDATKAEDADPTEFARRLDLAQDPSGDGLISMYDAMILRVEQIRDEATGTRVRERLPTGLRSLDDYLRGGFRPGWLIGLAGAQKQGKTGLAGVFGRASARAGFPVLLITQEMGAIEIAEREIAARSEVPIAAVEAGRGYNFDAVANAVREAQCERYQIGDTPLPWRSIQALARRWRKSNNDKPALIMIDYLQLIDATQAKGMTREQVLGAITRDCKRLAMELKCTVLLLCQLNDYKIASRADKRPQASDIRESGSLNKDCNVLLAIHRPWLYTHDDGIDPGDVKRDAAEIHVLANRHGPFPHKIDLVFQSQTTNFRDVNR
jgi:replicative DNA helicase